MSRASHPTALLRLLSTQLEHLEAGLVAVDTQVTLADGALVDLLARDNLGYPVIFLVCEADPHVGVGRMAAVNAALRRGHHLLTRLYADRGLDPSLRARFVLLAPRFPDDFAVSLDVLAYEVRAVEFRLQHDAAGKGRLDLFPYHRAGGGARAVRAAPQAADPASVIVPRTTRAPEPSASRPSERTSVGTPVNPAREAGENGKAASASTATVPRADPLASVDASADVKSLFVRARDSIRSLSGQLSESAESGRLSFRVRDRHLATLRLDPGGMHIQVGDDALPGRPVRDDGDFNAGLNAVFTHYFNDLSLRH